MKPEEVIQSVDAAMQKSDSKTYTSADKEYQTLLGARARLALNKMGYAVNVNKQKEKVSVYHLNVNAEDEVSQVGNAPFKKRDRSKHSYIVPKGATEIIDILQDSASHLIWVKGPTGCGKTVLTDYIAESLGKKLFQINCREQMGPEHFLGEKTIEIDEKTGQNHIVFKKGPAIQAMEYGLDENGNETGEGALLFIDEASAMPAHVAIALNRMLESDDPRRTVALDDGTIVRSHSKFRIVLAANTNGRGATSLADSMYAAQLDSLDISLLNRIAVCFRLGYDREAEKKILQAKIGDDVVVKKAVDFRDAVRKSIKEGKLMTPFSTRHLVNIADMYRIFGDLTKAVYYSTFELLLPEELSIYNEKLNAITGQDALKSYRDVDGVDYM